MKHIKNLLILFTSIFLGISLLCLPGLAVQEDDSGGNIIGFIFEADGTTPVEGASIKLQHTASGKVYESGRSDSFGIVKIKGIESGLYMMGVAASDGSFGAENRIGINVPVNATAKISVALKPYGKQEAAAVKEVEENRDENDEVLVGRVIGYDPKKKLAEVFIIKGRIKLKDRIHVKWDEEKEREEGVEKTDFYQKVKYLSIDGKEVDKAFADSNVMLKVIEKCEVDDLVYLVRKKQMIPFFLTSGGNLTAGGIAVITAVTGAIIYKTVDILRKEEEASPFK